jgi:hypothetical protein
VCPRRRPNGLAAFRANCRASLGAPSFPSTTIPRRRHRVCTLRLAQGLAYVRLMCGRVRLSSDVSEIKLVFSIPRHRPIPNFPPTWNGAPTDLLPVVRYDVKGGAAWTCCDGA